MIIRYLCLLVLLILTGIPGWSFHENPISYNLFTEIDFGMILNIWNKNGTAMEQDLIGYDYMLSLPGESESREYSRPPLRRHATGEETDNAVRERPVYRHDYRPPSPPPLPPRDYLFQVGVGPVGSYFRLHIMYFASDIIAVGFKMSHIAFKYDDHALGMIPIFRLAAPSDWIYSPYFQVGFGLAFLDFEPELHLNIELSPLCIELGNFNYVGINCGLVVNISDPDEISPTVGIFYSKGWE